MAQLRRLDDSRIYNATIESIKVLDKISFEGKDDNSNIQVKVKIDNYFYPINHWYNEDTKSKQYLNFKKKFGKSIEDKDCLIGKNCIVEKVPKKGKYQAHLKIISVY